MTCECGSNRIMTAHIWKASGTSSTLPNGTELEWIPGLAILDGSKDSTFEICCDCGKIQGWEKFPAFEEIPKDEQGDFLAEQPVTPEEWKDR